MNFMQALSWAKTAAQILPIATNVAVAVQAAFPPDTAGAKKMAVVKDSLQSMLATQQMVTTQFDSIWPFVQPLLSGIIQGFKTHSVSGFVPSATAAPTSLTTSPAPDAGEHLGG